jgi:2-phospho-L-lactate guanylyltransferase
MGTVARRADFCEGLRVNPWLVVPVKSLRRGKSRLAPALDAGERFALSQLLLLRTLRQAQRFPGLDRTLVVSGCEETCEFAVESGVHVLKESPPGGLNAALAQARAALRERGAVRMVAIPCDLPLLATEDLRRITSAPSRAIALAPDRARRGTNGICLPADIAFEFRFGFDSFERHLDSAHRLGLQSSIIQCDGLAFDIDVPADLTALNALHSDGRVPL